MRCGSESDILALLDLLLMRPATRRSLGARVSMSSREQLTAASEDSEPVPSQASDALRSTLRPAGCLGNHGDPCSRRGHGGFASECSRALAERAGTQRAVPAGARSRAAAECPACD